MTMLSDLLKEHGITAEQVASQSSAMEKRHVSDRVLDAKRRLARVEKKPYGELNLEKPKGLRRAVTLRSVQQAVDGKELTRIQRKKIARAVNAVLVQKKKDPSDARKLFGDVKSRKGKKKK